VVSTSRSGGVLGLTGVGHIGNVAVVVVGVVVDSLGPAVRKGNGVRSSNHTVSVIVLLLVEGSLAVVISDGVGEGVGAGLSKVVGDVSSLDRGVVSGSWLVSSGSGLVGDWGDHGSMIGRGGVDDGGSVDDRGMVRGSVYSVVSDNSISSVKSVGGISDNSSVSSEGLALGGGSVLSLVGLAH